MIFITVGTHEQQFNRLIYEIDKLKRLGKICEEVFIQTGYSDYTPKNCKWKKMISYNEMNEYMEKASIIITHGGPGSIFQCINYNKIPIVVPRNPKYDEHVDNHQIEFARRLHDKKSVISVENISDLENIITNYDILANKKLSDNISNAKMFSSKLEILIKELICR